MVDLLTLTCTPPAALEKNSSVAILPAQFVFFLEMANVAEKARFHLERSVPQLREFEEKEIFSKVRTSFTYHPRPVH